MVTDLNTTKKPASKDLPLRRANNPRYHSNYGKNSVTFRAQSSSLPLRSNTEGVYSAFAFRSSDSEVIGHREAFAIVSHRPTTLWKLCAPTLFITVVFVIFKFESNYSTEKMICQYLFEKFFDFLKNADSSRRGEFYVLTE